MKKLFKLFQKDKPFKDIDLHDVVIGIDLGTTYSCAAIYFQDKVIVFEDKKGQKTQASHVYFSPSGSSVAGNVAKDYAARDPANVVFDSKRLLSKSFKDPQMDHERKYLTFATIEEPHTGLVQIKVPNKKDPMFPEEVSSKVLLLMKSIAEERLKMTVNHAVVTVPAYFDDAQRKATKEAGRLAGLNIVKILNEPTAAAIAYGLSGEPSKTKYSLIYDLGGGTFDISLLKIEGLDFRVIAVNGDTHLGGEDFDNLLLRYVCEQYKELCKYDLMKNMKQLKKMKKSCEMAKIALSSKLVTEIVVKPNDGDGKTKMKLVVTRELFEKICNDLFQQTLQLVIQTLSEAKLSFKDINSIVLIGGSTKIPRIYQMLEQHFKKKPFNSINPDEAVAYGAAIVASKYMKNSPEKFRDLNLFDVVPLSFGIKGYQEKMQVLIRRNTPFPVKAYQACTNFLPDQKFVNIPIFQGERPRALDNRFLGDFLLNDLPKAQAGELDLEVTLEIDQDGILVLSAVEKKSKAKINVVVSSHQNKISKEDIEAALAEAIKNKEADELLNERFNVLEKIEYYHGVVEGLMK